MPPFISILEWRAISLSFHFMAIIFTTFRLYRRCKVKKMWWDDFCALGAFILDVALALTVLSNNSYSGEDYLSPPYIKCTNRNGPPDGSPNTPEKRQSKIILFWITGTFPAIIVWLARISICLSIARIDVQNTAIRIPLWTYLLISAFALVGGALVSQKIYVCARSDAWHYTNSVQCLVGKTSGYISITGDLLADSILTAISFRLLWKAHIRRSQKRVLSWLFAANIFSSLAGVLYGVMAIVANKLGRSRSPLLSMSIHIKVPFIGSFGVFFLFSSLD
ncbi:hypothetical protein NP233_g1009 [Leucocoprinus birnbaumii]|uniref:Rhodopsin domain-containing protein n=1 Tax=Leucocoprinus birnbaumii TaxID=56174 RepID=A0AAD5YW88_9AGAR|nr:hypothetical protein NP233_g1009 [Leucocoprinus birnbaumii]